MTASHYYITCGITNADTGESWCVSAMALIGPERMTFYIHPTPDVTHIVTARTADAPETTAILERMRVPVPDVAPKPDRQVG